MTDKFPAASEGGTGTRARTSAQCWECDTPDKCMSAELCYAGNAGFPKSVASVEGQRTPMKFTDEESTDPNVIQHIKTENRTENERLILAADAGKEQFEAWARQLVADKPFDLTPCDNPSCGPQFHHYLSDATNGAWSAWQAARRVPVEGQRTGAAECPECHAKSDVEAQQKCAPGEDNCPMTCWEHWPLQAEFDAREAEQIKLADKQIAESSVPGVEGMGAREQFEKWYHGPRSSPKIPPGTSDCDRDKIYAELYWNAGRSLRGAGGEGGPVAELIRVSEEDGKTYEFACINVGEERGYRSSSLRKVLAREPLYLHPSESREQALAEELQSMTELTQSWFQKNRALEAELKAQTEWRKVSKAAESREPLIVGMKSQLMQALKNHQEATFRIGEAESREQAMRAELESSRKTCRELNRRNGSLTHALAKESGRKSWYGYFSAAMKLFKNASDREDAMRECLEEGIKACKESSGYVAWAERAEKLVKP